MSLISPAFSDDTSNANVIKLFLAGDVMTGRGIDQVLQYSNKPQIYEPYMKSAKGYVELAENLNGPVDEPVSCRYLWGDALDVLEQFDPDLRMINLETSITTSDDYWRQKYIHYRMHPGNISCLQKAAIDYCSLANNHVLDWGYAGLRETITTLAGAEIKYAGAGMDEREAGAPAIMNLPGNGRVIVFSYGLRSSGVSPDWAAKGDRAGVNFLADLSDASVKKIRLDVDRHKQQNDIVVISLHWGDNWGYDIPQSHINFSHKLIDEAQVDLIHGHSSHHPRGIEIYKDKLILYGAGDFLNDYEGISGYEEYRDDLVLMYFANIDYSSGDTVRVAMKPMQIMRFSLQYASKEDAAWMSKMLGEASRRFGTGFELEGDTIFVRQVKETGK